MEYGLNKDESDMQAALERARQPDEWDTKVEKLSKIWESPEEIPSKETGDAKPQEMEGLDLTDPNAVGLRKPGAGLLDVISGGSVDEPKADAGNPPPMPPPERPTEPWAALKHDLEQGAKARPATDALESKMQAAGWAPRTTSTPPDWEALQKNLQAAQGMAGLKQSLQQWGHAVAPRFQADANAGAEDIAAAKTPLEVAQEKQRFEAQQTASEGAQLAQHEKLLAEAKAQSRRDPDSTESQHARDALRPLFERAGALPEGFEKWNADDVDQHAKLLTPIAGQLTQEHIAAAREKATADEKAAEAKIKADAAAKKETEEKKGVDALRSTIATHPRLAELGIKPDALDSMDRKGLEELDRNLRDLPNKKPGTGGPAKAVKALTDIPDPGERALTQAVLEGRTGLDGVDRKTKTHVLEMAAQIDPKFDATKFKQYEKVVEKQAASDDKMAIDVALEHLGTAERAIPKNADAQFINKVKQAIATGSGSPEFTPYVTASKVAAHELAKVYNIGDQGGKEMVEHILEAVQSPEQLQTVFGTLKSLVQGKKKGFEKQLANVAPKGGAAGEGPPSAGTVTVFDKKTRTSKNKTQAEADAIIKGAPSRFQIIGEPNP